MGHSCVGVLCSYTAFMRGGVAPASTLVFATVHGMCFYTSYLSDYF